MTFKKIAEEYFQELSKEVRAGTSGEATAELSYRTSLDNFFKKIAATIDGNISVIPEPKNQSKIGRPDWRFHDSESMGVYGYVEAKGLDQISEINLNTYIGQVEKYLVLGNPIILTDGIDFILFKQGVEPSKFTLCNKPINWKNPQFNLEIESMFKMFFGQIGSREISENILVSEVAKRAKLLTSEIIDLLELDEDEAEDENERITLNLLKELKRTAEQNHDKSLTNNAAFASFISQILTFGLLYAHRVIDNSCETPKEKYKRIHDFWFSYLEEDYSNKLIPFKTLVNALKSELSSDLSRLGLWYDDLRRLLAHIKLSEKQITIPDFHELYETFLSVYDRETRFDYGAFYTPRFLAFYTVDLVKEILSISIPDVDFESTPHKIIDPCCGTGTFIEAILDKIKVSFKSDIIGFEILPAPYALAHYRIAMLKEKYPDNIRIVLTNTLSDNLFEENTAGLQEESISSVLLNEQKVAFNLSSPPLTIIIGNPPSSDAQFQIPNEGERIQKLIEDFRPDKSGRTARQNTQKQLSNEFVKFLRWTIDRAIKSTPSIFALILPSSFAKHPSYKFARKYLYEKISELWVLEFDSDIRKGEGANVFETLQGRLLLVGVLKNNVTANSGVKYKTICGLSKQEKIAFFKNSVRLDEWILLDKLDENYAFKPQNDYDVEMYNRFWPITSEEKEGIFLRHCSGIKLAPTHLLVHISKGQLKRRSKFIAKAENNYDLIKDKWYSGQKKPPGEAKITAQVRSELNNAVTRDNIYNYSYRPFLEANVLLGEQLINELQNLEGGGTRDRPEIRAAYQDKSTYGFAVAPAPEDISDSLHKFSSFCWHIPDNDLSTRGNAHIFCNYFPEYKRKKTWDSNVKPNINSRLLESLAKLYSLKEEDLVNILTFYSYAVLSSDFYLDKFKGKLYNVAGEWPSIPITSDKKLFLSVSEHGHKLAKIESQEYEPEKTNLHELTEINYYKYKIEKSLVRLLDDTNKKLVEYNVEDRILNFQVSGYNVVREWLKMHSYPYYRKNFGSEEQAKFHILIKKIELYLDTVKEVDKLLEEIIGGDLYSYNNG